MNKKLSNEKFDSFERNPEFEKLDVDKLKEEFRFIFGNDGVVLDGFEHSEEFPIGEKYPKKVWETGDLKKRLELLSEIEDPRRQREFILKSIESPEFLEDLMVVLYGLQGREKLDPYKKVFQALQELVTVVNLPSQYFPKEADDTIEDAVKKNFNTIQHYIIDIFSGERVSKCLPLFHKYLEQEECELRILLEGEDKSFRFGYPTQLAVLDEKKAIESTDGTEFSLENIRSLKKAEELGGVLLSFDDFFINSKRFNNLTEEQKKDTILAFVIVLYRELFCAYSFKEDFKDKRFIPTWNGLAKYLEDMKFDGNNSELKKLIEWVWREPNGKDSTNSFTKETPLRIRSLFSKWRKMQKGKTPSIEKTIQTTVKKTEKITTSLKEKPIIPEISNRGQNKICLKNPPENKILWIAINGDIYPLDISIFEETGQGIEIDFSEFIKSVESVFSGRNMTIRISFGEDPEKRSGEVSLRLRKEELPLSPLTTEPLLEKTPEKVEAEIIPNHKPLEISREELVALALFENEDQVIIEKIENTLRLTIPQELLDEGEIDNFPIIVVNLETGEILEPKILTQELEEEILKVVELFEVKDLCRQEAEKAHEEQQKKEEAIQNHRERLNRFKDWKIELQLSEIWKKIRKTDIAFRDDMQYLEGTSISAYHNIHRLKNDDFRNGMTDELNQQLQPFGITLNITTTQRRNEPKELHFNIAFQTGDIDVKEFLVNVDFSKDQLSTAIRLEGDSETPSDIKEKLEGIARYIFNSVTDKCDQGLVSQKSNTIASKKESLRKRKVKKEINKKECVEKKETYELKKQAYLRLLNGEGRIVDFRNKDGYVASVKTRQSLASIQEEDEILLRNPRFVFPKSEDERWHFDPEKYDSFREVLKVVRERKYFIKRMMKTACEKREVSPGENTCEAIHHPKMQIIIEKVLKDIGESWKSLSDSIIRPSDLLDKKHPYSGLNWIDFLVGEFQKNSIPLFVDSALTITAGELLDTAEREGWDKKLSPKQSS